MKAGWTFGPLCTPPSSFVVCKSNHVICDRDIHTPGTHLFGQPPALVQKLVFYLSKAKDLRLEVQAKYILAKLLTNRKLLPSIVYTYHVISK